jgi:hypothetical protein
MPPSPVGLADLRPAERQRIRLLSAEFCHKLRFCGERCGTRRSESMCAEVCEVMHPGAGSRDHIPPKYCFFWFFLEAEITQQTQPAHPLPSPYTEHAGAGRCGGMHPRGPPEAPLEPRRKVGPLGPIKTFCQKKIFGGMWSRAHQVCKHRS